MSVRVRNIKNETITLKDGRGDSVTIPPKSSVQIASRFVDWVTPNPRVIRVLSRHDHRQIVAPPKAHTHNGTPPTQG
jgi:hypothetical protein